MMSAGKVEILKIYLFVTQHPRKDVKIHYCKNEGQIKKNCFLHSKRLRFQDSNNSKFQSSQSFETYLSFVAHVAGKKAKIIVENGLLTLVLHVQ